MGKIIKSLIYALLIIICSCGTGKEKAQIMEFDAGDITPELQEDPSDAPKNIEIDPSIETLRLRGGNIPDLSYLSMLHNLKELSIGYNSIITDISPLEALVNLRDLTLDLLFSLTDISPLKSLVNLEKLTLINSFDIESIDALSYLVNLKYLFITYRNSDFAELLPLTQLETLRIVSPRNGLDVSHIGQLRTLKHLEIDTSMLNGSGKINNIRRLGNLVNIEKLTLSCVDDLDLSWISSLQNLKEIRFSICSIDDISPLASLPNLETLDLTASRVRDITPLLQSRSIRSISGPILAIEYHDTFYILNNPVLIQGILEPFREKGIEIYPFANDR